MNLFGRSKYVKPARPSAVPAGASAPSDAAREARIREIGGRLLAMARGHKAGLFSARFYQDKLMDWSMQDHNFKVQLFRFVDTFPVLHSSELVHSVLMDYMSQPGVKKPPFMETGLKAGSIAKGMVASTMSGQIKQMASNFIAGTDARDALPSLKKLWDRGVAFSVDLLGEACVSDAEADMYRDKYLDLVNNLPETVSGWKDYPLLERDHLGAVPRTNVSVKVSALCAQFDPIAPERSVDDLMSRLEPILHAAREKGVFINFDMEQAELKDLTLEAFFRAKETIEFEGGLAMQAYLRSGVEDAQRVVDWAKRTGQTVTVRLVKGAYWDYEIIHAEQMGWEAKVWSEKWQTDLCFERMVEVFLDGCPRSVGDAGVKLALGSHNARSIAAALEGLDRRGLPNEALELQMLHGMADELKRAAADTAKGMGLRVREYVPVGEMIPGMAYLVRRLLENTSNESWLKAGFLDDASEDTLLAAPARAADAEPAKELFEIGPERHGMSPAVAGVGDGRAFFNEPPRDFSKAAVREAFGRAVADARVPEVANSNGEAEAIAMLGEAHAAFSGWRDADPLARARVLERTADAMAARRDELSGVVVRECGKPWREADGDICEAIDFCRYYARQAPGLFERGRIGKFIGELDELWYQPRGVCVVISPWNFPAAICLGMTVAALVTGNTVVMKPAEQSPGIAQIMAGMLHDAIEAEGLDTRALRFCPGMGETAGASLVRDPRTSVVAFTGSKAVGLDIIKVAGVTGEDQAHVKRVVCEMGGKNAVIVDATADLDEAVLGVRYSAFGFSGQKCSACSRVVVVDPDGPDGPHARQFVERLVESSRSLVVGNPIDSGTDVGPVIDDESADRLVRAVEVAKADSSIACVLDVADVELPADGGVRPRRCIGPKIFDRVTPDHDLARYELFGPVLAVMHARTFDEALGIANGHVYKLTGGVFTRTPTHIDRAKAGFRVGNLYVNRGCTGALVARMPFGGFGMSGMGSKAGGPDYLQQFVEPRASCENTMRRGFAPEL